MTPMPTGEYIVTLILLVIVGFILGGLLPPGRRR